MLDILTVRENFPWREIHYLESVDTTMRVATELAAGGCAAGTTVVADEQTAGIGRHGHEWHSAQDVGLYTSVVLRPTLTPELLPALTLAVGLATAEAIARAADLACDLRWPNDILLDEKKAAGILLQFADGAVIAGIGINVNQASFPPGFDTLPTSLRIASGRLQSRESLLCHLLQAVDSFCKMLVEGGRELTLRQFEKRSSYVRGKRVIVRLGESLLTGTTAGLTEAGFLMLRKDDGTMETILAGGVRAAGTGRR
ncbi:MAG: biotin--[acetyl-CoA-carboxylase] ligase [Bryobacteraceae bacterium]